MSMVKPFEIIFIQQDVRKHVAWALLQAKNTNPDAKIVLIGHPSYTCLSDLAEIHSSTDYQENAERLRPHFRSFSPNGLEFDFAVIARWLILYDYLRANNVEESVHLDSDVLVFSNLKQVRDENYPDINFSTVEVSGHTNYIRNLAHFERFIKHIHEAYTQENAYEILQAKADAWVAKAGGGGITDMTFVEEYSKLYPEESVDLSIPKNGGAFDINMEHEQSGYEMDEGTGLKKILWKDGRPYGILNGVKVLMHTLHLHGGNKDLMPDYMQVPRSEYKHYTRVCMQNFWKAKMKRGVSRVFGKLLGR